MTTQNDWISVCSDDDLVLNSGVCALVNDKEVAIFKMKTGSEDKVFAVSNWDPFGKANVLYRGLVGSVDGAEVIIAPLYKQRYNLTTGQCLDDESVKLTVYPVRVEQDKVLLQSAG
ncbi:nitrite reductase small subunit NirD [Paraglaciecola aquimarina]|uniref:Nitrite reductase small subunit NirD n=1 Tax=Paraglaciecola algarum TaxID=3050085 RepID=A0ABS9DCC4_9ALTE|nr:nitrite reductase small subunit NirD [Paraglaciecola sp. G1-23]MCF2949995.1 nitrite reductase small subunit NirD [Paraglaciecola sp. G1-23]